MMALRKSAGGTMKMKGLLLVGLCALCTGQHVRAGASISGGFKDSLTDKMVDSAAGALGKKPVELFVEDAYPVIVHGGLKKVYQAMRSSLLTLIYGDIEEVSDMVMAELQVYLFGSVPVQEKMWRRLRNNFRDYLREWWLDTLLDPYITLKNGVWQALLKLTADDLSVVIAGTPQYEKARKLLLDENTTVIDQWVRRIQRTMVQGADQQPVEGTSKKRGPFRGKSSRQEEKRPPREKSDSTAEGDSSNDSQETANTNRRDRRRKSGGQVEKPPTVGGFDSAVQRDIANNIDTT